MARVHRGFGTYQGCALTHTPLSRHSFQTHDYALRWRRVVPRAVLHVVCELGLSVCMSRGRVRCSRLHTGRVDVTQPLVSPRRALRRRLTAITATKTPPIADFLSGVAKNGLKKDSKDLSQDVSPPDLLENIIR